LLDHLKSLEKSKCPAHNHTNGPIDHIAFERELLESFQ
jgi:hypothetical protein